MSILPNYRFARLRFYAPMGVQAVIQTNDDVTGRWKAETARYYGDREKSLSERFANLQPDNKNIVAFTMRYGPLSGSPLTEPVFRFPIASWVRNQAEHNKFWRELLHGVPDAYEPLPGSFLEIKNGWIDYRCPDLWTFMSLEMLTQQSKLRICSRPDCKHPYFFAQHGKERYCSVGCSNWSQSELKKRWHEKQRRKKQLMARSKSR